MGIRASRAGRVDRQATKNPRVCHLLGLRTVAWIALAVRVEELRTLRLQAPRERVERCWAGEGEEVRSKELWWLSYVRVLFGSCVQCVNRLAELSQQFITSTCLRKSWFDWVLPWQDSHRQLVDELVCTSDFL